MKFTPEEWTKPEAPGMYITYTYARIKSALKGEATYNSPAYMKSKEYDYVAKCPDLKEGERWSFEDDIEEWSKKNPDPRFDLIQTDADLIGFANQHYFWFQQSMNNLDPAMLANFTYELASKLGTAYHSEQIKGGRYAFKHAVSLAVNILGTCMLHLGMFELDEV